MSNISLVNSDNSFAIHFFDFKFYEDDGDGYFQYKFSLQSRAFKMLTDTYSFAKELSKFREDLISLSKKECQVIYLAPLGEFWSIKFSRKELDIIALEGRVSDAESIQSRLEFRAFLSVDALSEVAKQVKEVFLAHLSD